MKNKPKLVSGARDASVTICPDRGNEEPSGCCSSWQEKGETHPYIFLKFDIEECQDIETQKVNNNLLFCLKIITVGFFHLCFDFEIFLLTPLGTYVIVSVPRSIKILSAITNKQANLPQLCAVFRPSSKFCPHSPLLFLFPPGTRLKFTKMTVPP